MIAICNHLSFSDLEDNECYNESKNFIKCVINDTFN